MSVYDNRFPLLPSRMLRPAPIAGMVIAALALRALIGETLCTIELGPWTLVAVAALLYVFITVESRQQVR